MYRIGIDVGGTNIAMGLVDESYRIIRKKSVKTDENSSPEKMIQSIAEGISELVNEAGNIADNALDLIDAIGIGVP